jgi:hypothetical protein
MGGACRGAGGGGAGGAAMGAASSDGGSGRTDPRQHLLEYGGEHKNAQSCIKCASVFAGHLLGADHA